MIPCVVDSFGRMKPPNSCLFVYIQFRKDKISSILCIPNHSSFEMTQGARTHAQAYSFFAFLDLFLHSVSECGKDLPFLVKQ